MERTSALIKPEAMIFDMDGTLFQTETVLLPAYHRLFAILKEEGLYMAPTPPEERILGCLGMLLEEIWKIVMPDGSERARARADELLLQLELEGLQTGNTLLYPGVKETLQGLKKQGVRLFVASNGLEHYVKGVAAAHGILELFDGVYSAGEHGTPSKVHLVDMLLKQQGVRSAWMVGDRSSDVEAGKENGLSVIGCAYAGFGGGEELQGSDQLIRTFTEIGQLYEAAQSR